MFGKRKWVKKSVSPNSLVFDPCEPQSPTPTLRQNLPFQLSSINRYELSVLNLSTCTHDQP